MSRLTDVMTLSNIYIYPIKGAGWIELPSTQLLLDGLLSDRKWLVADASTGMFVTQRSDGGRGVEVRSMSLVQPTIEGDVLSVNAPDMPTLQVPLDVNRSPDRLVTIWNDSQQDIDLGDACAHWVTTFVNKERPGDYRLVQKSIATPRVTKDGSGRVRFADAYPITVLGQASVDWLNARMQVPLPHTRYRPNLVFTGGNPFAEDSFKLVKIGPYSSIIGIKRCKRCVMTTQDPVTLQRGKEPLRTLAKHRRVDGGVVLSTSAIVSKPGAIQVGDVLQVLSYEMLP